MVMYKQDCFKRKPVLLGANSHVKAKMFPGVGTEPKKYVPFETVFKDGYYRVACVKDYMYYFGDKFGDHKVDYKLGQISNVSIVLYDSIIPKKDREPMSPTVCFGFCRTVPDMLFFGISNGRSCYCTPYFKQMESDDSQCDTKCEGNDVGLQTCGSKTKSSLFSMHSCADTDEKLESFLAKAYQARETLKLWMWYNAAPVAYQMQMMGEGIQKYFSNVGDSTMAALGQDMKSAPWKVGSGILGKAFDDFPERDTLDEPYKRLSDYHDTAKELGV